MQLCRWSTKLIASHLTVIKGSSWATWRHWRNWETRRSCKLTFTHSGELFYKSLCNYCITNTVASSKGAKGDRGYEGIPGFQGVKVFTLPPFILYSYIILLLWYNYIMLLFLGRKRDHWCCWPWWSQRKAGELMWDTLYINFQYLKNPLILLLKASKTFFMQ